MSVRVDATSVGRPTELFRALGIQLEWSVSADGERFLVAEPTSNSGQELTVLANWQSKIRH